MRQRLVFFVVNFLLLFLLFVKVFFINNLNLLWVVIKFYVAIKLRLLLLLLRSVKCSSSWKRSIRILWPCKNQFVSMLLCLEQNLYYTDFTLGINVLKHFWETWKGIRYISDEGIWYVNANYVMFSKLCTLYIDHHLSKFVLSSRRFIHIGKNFLKFQYRLSRLTVSL